MNQAVLEEAWSLFLRNWDLNGKNGKLTWNGVMNITLNQFDLPPEERRGLYREIAKRSADRSAVKRTAEAKRQNRGKGNQEKAHAAAAGIAVNSAAAAAAMASRSADRSTSEHKPPDSTTSPSQGSLFE